MPRGFMGFAAAAYLGEVTKAHTNAVAAGRQTTERAPTNTDIRERRLPFDKDDAFTGGFTSGRRDSSNIVVSQQEYDAVGHMLCKADESMGACIYSAAMEIEALCQTAFILPSAVPGCLNISESVKNSLEQFRGFTDDAVLQARRFAREITEIGG